MNSSNVPGTNVISCFLRRGIAADSLTWGDARAKRIFPTIRSLYRYLFTGMRSTVRYIEGITLIVLSLSTFILGCDILPWGHSYKVFDDLSISYFPAHAGKVWTYDYRQIRNDELSCSRQSNQTRGVLIWTVVSFTCNYGTQEFEIQEAFEGLNTITPCTDEIQTVESPVTFSNTIRATQSDRTKELKIFPYTYKFPKIQWRYQSSKEDIITVDTLYSAGFCGSAGKSLVLEKGKGIVCWYEHSSSHFNYSMDEISLRDE